MRLTIITPLYPPDLGRLSRYVKELAIRFHREHEVTVVTYGAIPEEVSGVLVRSISKNLPIPLRIALFTIRLWREARYSDALYVCDGASVGWPAIIVSWFWRIPVVRLVMADEVWERAQPLRATSLAIPNYSKIIDNKLAMVQALQRWVLHQADYIFVPTETLKRFFRETQQVPEEHLQVALYPPDRPELLPFASSPVPHQLLVTSPLTTLEPFQALLIAVGRLQSSFTDLRLIFANNGPLEPTLQTLVETLGIQARVTFLGVVSHAQTWDLLRSSAALIALTEEVNQLDTLHEGLVAGIPLVALESPEHQALLEPGVSGIILDNNQTDTLVQTITRLFESPALQEQLRVGGQQRIEQLAGWDQHLERLTACVPSSMLSPTL